MVVAVVVAVATAGLGNVEGVDALETCEETNAVDATDDDGATGLATTG